MSFADSKASKLMNDGDGMGSQGGNMPGGGGTTGGGTSTGTGDDDMEDEE